MGVKVYFNYDGEGPQGVEILGQRLGREEYKAKITLPDSWMAGPVERLLTFFVQTYNKKFPDKPLSVDEMKLVIGDVELPVGGIASQFVQEHNDILVLHRPRPVEVAAGPPGSLVCGNFGCGKRFMPAENSDTACHHHAKGPVFHDTAKYWGCCPSHKALDWEQFEAIPRCVIGPHAVSDRAVTFQSPNSITNTALSADQVAAMSPPAAMMTDDGPRRTGPREFEGAAAVASEPGPIAEDGTARCRNFGCQQRFVVADNSDTACRFHAAGPVFWDTYKYWKCCPDRKHMDFDDFAKVEGCTTGPHKR
jgi:hypothetical protein